MYAMSAVETAAVPEAHELVEQVARGLAGQPRKEARIGGRAFAAVAGDAGGHALLDGVGHGGRRRGARHALHEEQQREREGAKAAFMCRPRNAPM
jgi:hypothetical protein